MPADVWEGLDDFNLRASTAFSEAIQSRSAPIASVSTEESIALRAGVTPGYAGDDLIIANAGVVAQQLGKAGESAVRAVRNIGPKTVFLVNGVRRIADGIRGNVMTRSKTSRTRHSPNKWLTISHIFGTILRCSFTCTSEKRGRPLDHSAEKF